MSSSYGFLDREITLQLESSRVLAEWSGPEGRTGVPIAQEMTRQLESPLDFPPLRMAVVPGDRVVIAVDENLPDASSLIAPIVNLLHECGVDSESLTVLTTLTGPARLLESLPNAAAVVSHDRGNRESLAYLATTSSEQRVYLHRSLVEADFVLSIASAAPDPEIKTWGPWATIYPGLSDNEAMRRYRQGSRGESSSRLTEIAEVAWLLGNQFQVAIVPGARGVREIIAGEAAKVVDAATRRMEKNWTFVVDRRAEMVVVDVNTTADLEELWFAFEKASGLVRRGGKILALSKAQGDIGPAASHLAGDDRPGLFSLRGAEALLDYASASALARALDWADLYLLSAMNPDTVESLGVMPLTTPSEAQRLAGLSSEVTILHHPRWTRTIVREELS